jgi:anti-anti-sigma regulatory factor
MTLRIFEEPDERGAVIALHGWLSGPEVGEVERLAAAAAGRSVRIDLVHLVGVDADGLQALKRLQGGGARLTGASPYVEMLLERTDFVGDDRPVK